MIIYSLIFVNAINGCSNKFLYFNVLYGFVTTLNKMSKIEINNIYKYDFTNKKIFEDDKEIVLTRNESILLSLLLTW